MDLFYGLYIALCGTSLILSSMLVIVHLNAKEYKNISFQLIFHLLLSYYIISYNRCILVSLGGLLSLLKQFNVKLICEFSNGLIVIFLTSAITWMTFTNFLIATNNRIKLQKAIILMMVYSYLLPLGIYITEAMLFEFLNDNGSNDCQLFKNKYEKTFGIMSIYPLLILFYNLYLSRKSIGNLVRKNNDYPFFRGDILKQKTVPFIIFFIFMPFYINLDIQKIQPKSIDFSIDICTHVMVQVGLFTIIILYGINPTLQKFQAVKYINLLRRVIREKENLEVQRLSSNNESEMSHIDRTIRQNDFDDLIKKSQHSQVQV